MAEKQPIRLFVPGRLCLFGEHSDWAGMYRTVNADIVKGTAIVSGTTGSATFSMTSAEHHSERSMPL